MKKRISKIVAILLIMLFFFPLTCYGVAGGGGADYGGGGDSPSTGGTSNNDRNSSDYNHSDSNSRAPFAVTVLTVLLFSTIMSKSSTFLERNKSKALLLDEMDRPKKESKELIQKIEQCFVAVQKAWSNQDLEKAKNFYTDSLYEVHQKLIEEAMEEHQQNIVKNIKIQELYSFHELNANSFRITIKASVVDYTIDTRTQEVIQGFSDKRGTINQVWYFNIDLDGNLRVDFIH